MVYRYRVFTLYYVKRGREVASHLVHAQEMAEFDSLLPPPIFDEGVKPLSRVAKLIFRPREVETWLKKLLWRVWQKLTLIFGMTLEPLLTI